MDNTLHITFNANSVILTNGKNEIIDESPIIERDDLAGWFVSLSITKMIAYHCNSGKKIVVRPF